MLPIRIKNTAEAITYITTLTLQRHTLSIGKDKYYNIRPSP